MDIFKKIKDNNESIIKWVIGLMISILILAVFIMCLAGFFPEFSLEVISLCFFSMISISIVPLLLIASIILIAIFMYSLKTIPKINIIPCLLVIVIWYLFQQKVFEMDFCKDMIIIIVSVLIFNSGINHINKEYLFSWNDVPGNDSVRLVDYLVKDLKINWVKDAKIEKVNDKTITVTKGENSIEIKLNKSEDKVILKTGTGETHKYLAKMENGKLNISKTENSELNKAMGTGLIVSAMILFITTSVEFILLLLSKGGICLC